MENLKNLRNYIDALDGEIKQLLIKRYEAVKKIGEIKKQNGLNVSDESRETVVLNNVTSGLSGDLRDGVYNVYQEIIKNSKNLQI